MTGSEKINSTQFKGGYLHVSHLTEWINITEIYVKKQWKSSIPKNHKIEKKNYFFYGVPLKGYVARKKKSLWESQVTNDA